MAVVEIKRTDAIRKIGCINTLCSVAGLSLSEARRVMDVVVSGLPHRVGVGTDEAARKLVELLQLEGAQASVQAPDAAP